MEGFSIVLCTYNGAGRLGPTLTRLAALAIPESHGAELIVVNNASTDDTAALVQKIWLQLGSPYPLRLLNENRPGKGYAVETGYDAAAYSYIVTVDDDNWLSPDYLAAAVDLFRQHEDIGVLQGRNSAVFEEPPPPWFEELQDFFVIGSPVKSRGYFPPNYCGVWGAGMVIKTDDWKYLRSIGFAFLTSKRAGKAAGEDHETAIALLLLGRKIYYSDTLTYQHFMPAGRVSWKNLKNGFTIWAYLTYYYTLYALVIDAHETGKAITKSEIYQKTISHFFAAIRKHTPKQQVAYWIMPKKELYQLKIYRDFCFLKWALQLSKTAMNDVEFLQSWMWKLPENKQRTFKISFAV